jgi:2-oxoglutarate ferredoxin oxidoreductase subunit beta
MVTVQDFVGLKPAWCPGCGNFGILRAVNKALAELNLKPHQVLMVSGIGQAGKLPHYSRANVFNSLHGRALPVAIGAKLANPELTVIVMGGDGDGYGEGGNHFLHSLHRNHDITYMVHDNQIYGLTKGQASPTSDEDFVTKTTPQGAIPPLNPVGLALMSGASFIARGFSGDVDHLSALIQQAIRHKGFSFIDILQPCVSFNHKNTYQWYRERVYRLEDEGYYDPTDKRQAMAKAEEWGERIPLGIIYREERITFEERQTALRKGPLVRQDIEPARAKALVEEFR